MSVLAHLEQALATEQSVLLAYSGGLDSSVLLHQLVLLRGQRPALQLRAVHIHHGLSPYADDWAAHCQQQCAQWQVPLQVIRVQLDLRNGGVEAAARTARYHALQQTLQPAEALLTAQHQDDQSETLLLALKRGSGPAGLAAMPAAGWLAGHRHLRPLLTVSREQLEQWAVAHQLRWIEDESNQDARYDRNFLRLQVLPLLNSRWPHFAASSARSAALCGEQEQLLDELLAESLAILVDHTGSLHVPPLFAMSEVRRAALLRRWIAGCQGEMPSRAALQRLWQEVACAREDAEPRLRVGNAEIRRFRDRLWWLPLTASVREICLLWQAPWPRLRLPDNLGLLVAEQGMITAPTSSVVRPPRPGEIVSVRFQAQGRFHIVGRTGSRPLKKLWQEFAVPPWQRERIPLIFYGEQLIAATGRFVTCEGAPQPAQPVWTLNWVPESKQGG